MIQKSKEWPGVWSCKFLEAGLVSYEDSDAGIALIKKETIDRMLPSFIGKPVCIHHHSITPDNYADLKQKGVIVGNVIKVWFNQQDGWFWADFLVETEEGRKCIEQDNYSVSCAYNVISVQEGGLWHDIKFDGEITDGAFTHLALVETPRYEDSRIVKQLPSMLVNGKIKDLVKQSAIHKPSEVKIMNWKFWEKKENSKEDAEKLGNLHVEIDGKTLSLTEVLNAVEKSGLFRENKNGKTLMCAKGDIVDIEGHTYPIAELVDAYNMKKQNEKEADEKKAEEEAKAKENEKAEEEKKKLEEAENAKKIKEAEELANSKKKDGEKFFDELNNAKGGEGDGAPALPLSRSERAERWHKKNKR